MTEKYKESHPMGGTSSDPLDAEMEKPAIGLDGWLLKKLDARADKQQADKKSMEFGRRMGTSEYH